MITKVLKDFDSVIAEFSDYEYNVRGKSAGWRRELKVYLRKFGAYLELNNLDCLNISISDALAFKKHLVESTQSNDKKYSTVYINSILITVKHLYKYLITHNYLYQNSFEYISILREEEKVMNELPKEKELCDILNKLSFFYEEKNLYKKITRYKMHLVAELMYSTGMRISEAALLKKEDVYFDKGIVKITDIKTKTERFAFLNEYVLKLLKIYMEKKDTLFFRENKSSNKNYLFGCSIHQLNLTLNAALESVTKNKMTTHKLRHCFGYHFLKRGCDIFFIKHFLGHKSIDNTQIYTKIDKEDLKNILEKNHPRKFRKA